MALAGSEGSASTEINSAFNLGNTLRTRSLGCETMRRRQPKDLSDSWKPRRSLRVYLDDIEELFELLGAVGNVAAETKDFVDIANADDLHTLDEDEDVNELLPMMNVQPVCV